MPPSPFWRANSSRRAFLQVAGGAGALASPAQAAPAQETSDREYWVGVLTRIADPVLNALANGELHTRMPVEAPHGNAAERREYTHLEALGRLLAGMAPWLELSGESGRDDSLRLRYAELARKAIAAGCDPSSPDFMNFTRGRQPVVDAAFLAHALLRAPEELWRKLGSRTQTHVVQALRSTRTIQPPFNNWLLFSAMIEAALCQAGEDWDRMRVDYAVRQVNEWYKGDGVYGDGPQFHWDYYNSFVMHPMLLDVLETVSKSSSAWSRFHGPAVERARRYAAIQERLIGPDGTYPPIGRSLPYRFGAFQLLAQMTLHRQLPDALTPEQVRCGLTAVIRRMIEAPGTFDPDGWLTIGFCGHQAEIAESYISTGSLYLCTTGMLPLGLASSDPFWSNPPAPWTQKKAWSGQEVRADHALPAV